jgi:hypothetical protein
MRYREPDERDPFDPVIARAMKQWVNRHPTPPAMKREILRRAAMLAPFETGTENLLGFVIVNLKGAGTLLYRLFAREAFLVSTPATAHVSSAAGRYLHMADHELIYSSAGGVGMLSLMG